MPSSNYAKNNHIEGDDIDCNHAEGDCGDSYKNKRVIFACGGTGGHVFPAVSLAEYMVLQGIRPLFLIDGRVQKYFTNLQIFKDDKIDLFILPIRRKQGLLGRVIFASSIFLALIRAFGKIVACKPHAVYGFGGYPSFPTVLAFIIWRGISFTGRAKHRVSDNKGKGEHKHRGKHKHQLILHEQNSVIGRVNLKFIKYADVFALSFPIENNIVKINSHKIVIVGNPIRSAIKDVAIAKLNKQKCKDKKYNHTQYNTQHSDKPYNGGQYNRKGQKPFTITITGGSQASKKLGQEVATSVIKAINHIRQDLAETMGESEIARAGKLGNGDAKTGEDCKNIDIDFNIGFKIYHQSLPVEIKKLQEIYQKTGWQQSKNKAGVASNPEKLSQQGSINMEVQVKDFFPNIEELLAESDLFIGRAGSSTIFETLYLQIKRLIFIPLATSKDNHQYYNALYAKNHGGAKLITEKELGNNAEMLFQEICDAFYMFQKTMKEQNTITQNHRNSLEDVVLEPDKATKQAIRRNTEQAIKSPNFIKENTVEMLCQLLLK